MERHPRRTGAVGGMRGYAAYLFCLPALLFLAAFAAFPMLQIVYYSVLEYSVFDPGRFSGFENYRNLASDVNFWWVLLNSLLFVLVSPVMIVVSLSLALLVRRAGRLSGMYRAGLFLPVVTPIVIAGIIWRWMFTEDTGLLNYLLSLAGMEGVFWLTEYPTNLVSVAIVTLWRGAGYYMMIFLAGLAALPDEVEEASLLDGANVFQQAVYILVPLLRPTITFVFVVSATAAIRLFTELYILIPGTPLTNKTLVSYLYIQAFERFDLGYGSAIAVVIFLLTFGFSVVQVRYMERHVI